MEGTIIVYTNKFANKIRTRIRVHVKKERRETQVVWERSGLHKTEVLEIPLPSAMYSFRPLVTRVLFHFHSSCPLLALLTLSCDPWFMNHCNITRFLCSFHASLYLLLLLFLQSVWWFRFFSHSLTATSLVEDPAFCAIALTLISVAIIVVSLPFSLFFCIKVCHQKKKELIRDSIYSRKTFLDPFILCLPQVVQEYERAVIFRLGRLVTGGARGPGIFFIIPCIDTYSKADLRTVSFDVPPQEVWLVLREMNVTDYLSASLDDEVER